MPNVLRSAQRSIQWPHLKAAMRISFGNSAVKPRATPEFPPPKPPSRRAAKIISGDPAIPVTTASREARADAAKAHKAQQRGRQDGHGRHSERRTIKQSAGPIEGSRYDEDEAIAHA